MKVLILGGTVFLGRAICEAGLAAGHELTLFHRGRHAPGLFPNARHVLGDRDAGLQGLEGGRWDAVIDCSGYVPRIVRQSAGALQSTVGCYVFVSSISALAQMDVPGLDETAPPARIEDVETEVIDGRTYGALKVLCEEAVVEVYQDRALILRPGLIAGPHDPTNRFTHWVRRFGEGGEVLTPDRFDQPLQLIDVRDIASFVYVALHAALGGVYNLVGESKTFGAMIDACQLGTPGSKFPAPEAALESVGVALWSDLPLAVPRSGESDGMMQVNGRKAEAAGLKLRPTYETVEDTRVWTVTSPLSGNEGHGISRERETAAIKSIRGSTG